MCIRSLCNLSVCKNQCNSATLCAALMRISQGRRRCRHRWCRCHSKTWRGDLHPGYFNMVSWLDIWNGFGPRLYQNNASAWRCFEHSHVELDCVLWPKSAFRTRTAHSPPPQVRVFVTKVVEPYGCLVHQTKKNTRKLFPNSTTIAWPSPSSSSLPPLLYLCELVIVALFLRVATWFLWSASFSSWTSENFPVPKKAWEPFYIILLIFNPIDWSWETGHSYWNLLGFSQWARPTLRYAKWTRNRFVSSFERIESVIRHVVHTCQAAVRWTKLLSGGLCRLERPSGSNGHQKSFGSWQLPLGKSWFLTADIVFLFSHNFMYMYTSRFGTFWDHIIHEI